MTTKNKRILAAAAALLMLLGCLTAGCGKRTEARQTEPTAVQDTPGVYTVALCNDNGSPLEGVGIYVYTDATKQELVWFARTDADGRITFRDVTSEGYIAVLDGVSSDYLVEEHYPLTGEYTTITVVAQMQSDVDLSAVTRALGDVMFDFTVTSTDGVAYTLSELLKEKDAVVLNFWYLNCGPCKQEFPYLQEAYEAYSDKIALLAMNPVDGTDETINAFRKELGLTFSMFACDPDWASAMKLNAYPTTVVIDRCGTISLIHGGSITSAKVFTDAFAHFTAEEYVPGVVEDIMELETEVPGSDPNEPIEMGGVLKFEATIPAGMKIYYHLYRVSGYLTVKNADIYAVYNGRTYGPKSGGIGFSIEAPDTYTPAVLTLGNSGKEDLTVTVNIAKPAGVVDNPYPASLGEFTTKVSAGNAQGVYYQYKATEEGYLTISCLEATAGIQYDYSLYNLRSCRLNSISADGNAEGTMVSVKVNAGDSVKIQITTIPDSGGNYPAGNFKSRLFMSDTPVTEETELEPKIDYAVTVTDEYRKPLANVYLSVDTGDNKQTTIITDEKGVAHTRLAAGTYPVVLTLPGGYTAATTEFTLTEARPFVSVKLDTVVVKTVTYTVTVTDEAGNPLEGVSAMIGSVAGVTDAEGKVVFTLPEGSYTVTLSMPDGSVVNQTFAPDQTEMTVAAKQESPDEPEPEEKITYTVKVTDYSGKPQSNVTVQFLSSGSPVAVQKTDRTGSVSAELPAADYTVSLAFTGKQMYYEEKDAVLKPGAPSLVLRVTSVTGGTPEPMWFGPTYTVGVGGVYVQMQSNVVTYFAFEPTQQGTYRVTASDPTAEISYWGSIAYPIRQEINDGAPASTFELNVKENNLGNIYAIGITGVDDCILIIERTGDAVLDDTDVPWQVYEGNRPTQAYRIGSKKTFTYVDMTQATEDVVPVLGADGFYHLNSADGPVLYMNLGPNAPYLPMYSILGLSGIGGTKFAKSFYNEDGTLLKKEDYSACMIAYTECRDPVNQVYPVTEDLMYMMKNGGEAKGWWDVDNEADFQFAAVGDGFNPELGWMFAVCYIKS